MNFWNAYVKMLIVEGVAALFIIISVLAVKFFFKDTYKDLSEWYKENVLVDTDISEVINSEI